MPRIALRILKRAGLASSAISSSEIIHLLISSFNCVRGSNCEKSPERESVLSSFLSERSYAFERFATSRRLLIRRSSAAFRLPPMSSLFSEAFTLWVPEKENATVFVKTA